MTAAGSALHRGRDQGVKIRPRVARGSGEFSAKRLAEHPEQRFADGVVMFIPNSVTGMAPPQIFEDWHKGFRFFEELDGGREHLHQLGGLPSDIVAEEPAKRGI